MATSAEDFKGTSGPVPWDIGQGGETQSGKQIPALSTNGVIQGHGNLDLTFNVAGVTPGSNVAVSLCELNAVSRNPMLGLASLAVYNVVPLNGQVQVRMSIGWQNDILVRVAFIVF